MFAVFGKFPGAVHEGNGTQQLVIDQDTTPEQREAIRKIVAVQNELVAEINPNKRSVPSSGSSTSGT